MGTQHLLSRAEQAAMFKREKCVKVVAEDKVVNVQMAERASPVRMAQEVHPAGQVGLNTLGKRSSY